MPEELKCFSEELNATGLGRYISCKVGRKCVHNEGDCGKIISFL
jgi:hypothetical protein